MPYNTALKAFWSEANGMPVMMLKCGTRMVRFAETPGGGTGPNQDLDYYLANWDVSYRKGGTTHFPIMPKHLYVKPSAGGIVVAPTRTGRTSQLRTDGQGTAKSFTQIMTERMPYINAESFFRFDLLDPERMFTGFPEYIPYESMSAYAIAGASNFGLAKFLAHAGDHLRAIDVSETADEGVRDGDFLVKVDQGFGVYKVYRLDFSSFAARNNLNFQKAFLSGSATVRWIRIYWEVVNVAGKGFIQYYVEHSTSATNEWTAGAQSFVGTETATGAAVRLGLGLQLTSTIGVFGETGQGWSRACTVEGAQWVKSRSVVGLHESIKAFEFKAGDFVNLNWIAMNHTKDEMVTILLNEKPSMDNAGKAAVDSAVSALNGSSPRTAFATMLFENPVGPYDIYDMDTIVYALSKGTTMAEIDAHIINGYPLSYWRTKALAEPAAHILCCFEQGVSDVLTDLDLLPDPTDLVYKFKINTSVGVTIPIVGNEYFIEEADLEAILTDSEGLYLTSADVLAAVLTRYGITRADNVDLTVVRNHIKNADIEPWNQMPLLWFKHVLSKSWSPIAKALVFTLTETASEFETV